MVNQEIIPFKEALKVSYLLFASVTKPNILIPY